MLGSSINTKERGNGWVKFHNCIMEYFQGYKPKVDEVLLKSQIALYMSKLVTEQQNRRYCPYTYGSSTILFHELQQTVIQKKSSIANVVDAFKIIFCVQQAYWTQLFSSFQLYNMHFDGRIPYPVWDMWAICSLILCGPQNLTTFYR